MQPASLRGFLRRLCVNEVQQHLARENPAFSDRVPHKAPLRAYCAIVSGVACNSRAASSSE